VNNHIHKILEALKDQKILITSHRDPDGDCLGSTVAMTLALQQLGYEVTAVNRDMIPYRYAFLDPSGIIKTPHALSDYDHQVAIVLDASDLLRLGYDMHALFPHVKTIINIDHHMSNQLFGDINLIKVKAAANCEILYDVLTLMNVVVNEDIANALYVGITTDTGSFKYEATSSKTLRIAASLIDHGADINLIRTNVWENEPFNRILALSEVLDNLKISEDGRLSWIKISQGAILKHQLTNGDLESFVDYPRTITGVEVALFIKEIEEGFLKVSIRTKSLVDATKIAGIFGGGGHKRAAGFKIKGDLLDQEAHIIEKVKQEIDREFSCMDLSM